MFENAFSFVAPRLAGSCCPGICSDSKIAEDLRFLQAQGVVAAVALNDCDLDEQLFAQVSIAFLRVSVSDYQAPSVVGMRTIVQFAAEHRELGTVVVFCNAGMGRTGTVLAVLIALTEGRTSAAAVAHVRALRRGSVQTYKQERFIEEFVLAMRGEA